MCKGNRADPAIILTILFAILATAAGLALF
jgi:hypothetical protein